MLSQVNQTNVLCGAHTQPILRSHRGKEGSLAPAKLAAHVCFLQHPWDLSYFCAWIDCFAKHEAQAFNSATVIVMAVYTESMQAIGHPPACCRLCAHCSERGS